MNRPPPGRPGTVWCGSCGGPRLALTGSRWRSNETRCHMDQDLVDRVIETAAAVVAGGAISDNGHGNISIRQPGSDEMYYTSGPSLRGLTAAGIARVGLDGALREGELPPI